MPNGLKEFWWRTWRFIKSWYFVAFMVVLLAVILPAVGAVIWKWEWLREFDDAKDSNSDTFRNVALIVAGILALVFAMWRSKIADVQSKIAQRQADTAQRGLLNERYQKGAEMLGSVVSATRMGGIFALQRLAEEHPNEYHILILRLLCAFVRQQTNGGTGPGSEVSEEVQSAIYAIRACRQKDTAVELEQADNFRLNLTRAHLRRADLSEINLSNADLPDANLSRTYLGRAILSGAYLQNANLAGATMAGTDISRANLSGAKLTADSLADITPMAGLTQGQLDSACADSSNHPTLEAIDDATSESLVWHDRPCQSDG